MSDNIFLNKIWNPEKKENLNHCHKIFIIQNINNFVEGRDNIQTGGGGKKRKRKRKKTRKETNPSRKKTRSKGQGEASAAASKDKDSEDQVQQHQRDKDKEDQCSSIKKNEKHLTDGGLKELLTIS